MSPTLRGPLRPVVGSALTGKSLLRKMRVTPNYTVAWGTLDLEPVLGAEACSHLWLSPGFQKCQEKGRQANTGLSLLGSGLTSHLPLKAHFLSGHSAQTAPVPGNAIVVPTAKHLVS